ncbi:MAG: DoxX family protein [Mucilaginibacter sp.]|nr:DoxX family protein [Mucilaginibacter sp.]
MEILIFLLLLLLGAALHWLLKLENERILQIGKGYVYLSLLIALTYWILSIPAIRSGAFNVYLKNLQTYGKYLSYVLIGFLTAYMSTAINADQRQVNIDRTWKIARLTRWGTSIFLGSIFLIATIGKMRNFDGMYVFFKESGYAKWFLYFIMTAEAVGGIGVLMHFKFKTGVWAASGLMLSMIGAIVTHWRNGDPFSDSYAAAILLTTLILLQINYYYEKLIAAR